MPDASYSTQPPRRALLCVGHTTHDVLVIRETRGRYQIRLPEGADPVRLVLGGTRRTIRDDLTTSVPMNMIELR